MDNDDVKTQNQSILICEEMLVNEKISRDTFYDIEDHLVKFPKITLILIVLNVIVFIWELFSGALTNVQTLINAGALHHESIKQGEILRFVSAMFLHGDFVHLFGNMLMLYISGIIIESMFKQNKFIIIYFMSGICGGLLSFTFSKMPSVGASGAIFGLMGACIAFFRFNEKKFNILSKRISGIFIIFAVFSLLMGLTSNVIDNYAHIGGFICGFLITVLTRNLTLETEIL